MTFYEAIFFKLTKNWGIRHIDTLILFSHWKSRLVKDNDSDRFVRWSLPTPLPVFIKSSVLHVYCPNIYQMDSTLCQISCATFRQ